MGEQGTVLGSEVAHFSRERQAHNLYWKDASLNTLDCSVGGKHFSIYKIVLLEECINTLDWKNASINALNLCIEGMHLLIVILEECISQFFI